MVFYEELQLLTADPHLTEMSVGLVHQGRTADEQMVRTFAALNTSGAAYWCTPANAAGGMAWRSGGLSLSFDTI